MWDKVSAGDPVTHSARRENAITDVLNAFQGLSARNNGTNPFTSVVLTGISEGSIGAYTPVKIISSTKDLICKVDRGPIPGNLWGITTNKMRKGVTEMVVLRGLTPAQVNIKDTEHRYATLQDGELISTEEATSCRILTTAEETGSQLAAVLLESWQTPPSIETAFRVTKTEEETLSVSGGYINRNGTFLIVPPKEGISLQAGTLCIQSKIENDPEGKNGETKWTTPDYIYTDPAPDSWPIADIKEEEDEKGNKHYTICQRLTNVAILMVSKQCPLIKKGS